MQRTEAGEIGIGCEIKSLLPAPIIHAERARLLLSAEKSVSSVSETASLLSKSERNELHRALSLTTMIMQHRPSREEIWKCTDDESSMVKKVAIRGLGSPLDQLERKRYWQHVHQEAKKDGVRESWVYALFSSTDKDELEQWMSLTDYRSIDIWICINLFLQNYYPDAPEMDISSDPDPKVMDDSISHVLEWYKQWK
jgi:serine protease AprX